MPDQRGGAPTAVATALLDGLSATGATHVVLSPGSRSTPLAMAASACDAFAVTVLVDERSAAFFALGVARHAGRPAILIATSGSAPAHWLPAFIEAAEDGVPILAVSADRPPELVGCGANQATHQDSILASHARGVFSVAADMTASEALDEGRRAALIACYPQPGPVHVNLAIRDPRPPSAPLPAWAPTVAPIRVPSNGAAILPEGLAPGGRGMIVCGRLPPVEGLPERIAALAEALDVPILADVLSGLRFGDGDASRLVAGELALRARKITPADWSIEIGGAPVSRTTSEWAGRTAFRMILTNRADWPDPGRTAACILAGGLNATLDVLAHRLAPGPGLLGTLREAELAARQALKKPGAMPAEARAIAELFALLPENTPVFAGNSMVIRDVDAFAAVREMGPRIRGNRGVSGIDGNLSTAAGLIDAANQAGVALLGDLALFHDLNALHLLRDRPVVAFVIDNGGGGIFGLLPHQHLQGFERLWLTPTGLNIEAAAAAFDIECTVYGDPVGAATAVANAVRNRRGSVVVLRVDRADSESRRRDLWLALPHGGSRP